MEKKPTIRDEAATAWTCALEGSPCGTIYLVIPHAPVLSFLNPEKQSRN